MMIVKLSDKACLFCGKNQNTVQAKAKEHDFQGIVCTDHMVAILKRWERKEEANAPVKPSG
jgi:hypothetical protein